MAAFLLVALVVCVAPTLICRTPLRNWLAARLLTGLDGAVRIETARWGWLSAVRLEGVTVCDSTGGQLLSIETITGSKSLLALLGRTDRLGSLHVVRPEAHIKLRTDGSNFEDAFAGLLQQTSAGGTIDQLEVFVEGGAADIVEAANGRSWRVCEIQGQLEFVSGVPALRGQVAGAVAADTAGPGRFAATLTVPAAGAVPDGAREIRAQVDFDALPASVASPFLRRLGHPADVSARVSGSVVIGWNPATERLSAKADRLRVEAITLTAPEFLRGDRLELAQLAADGSIVCHGRRIDAETVVVTWDFGRLEVSGTIDVTDPQTFVHQAAAGNGLTARLDADLARLAAAVPRAARLRRDVQLADGKLAATVTTGRDGTRNRLLVDVRTNDIVGRRSGRPFTLREPLQFSCALQERPSLDATSRPETGARAAHALWGANTLSLTRGIELEYVRCESAFLRLAGRGDGGAGELVVDGDFAQLLTQIGQLIDTKDARAEGRFHADLRWGPEVGRSALGRVADATADAPATGLTCQAQLADLNTRFLGWTCIQAGRTEARLDAALAVAEGTIQSIEAASFAILAGEDSLQVDLTGPLSTAFAEPMPAWAVSITGGVHDWLDRLALASLLGDTHIDGRVDARGQIRVGRESIAVDGLNYQIRDFVFRGGGRAVAEPMVTGTATARWDRVHHVLTTGSSTLVTPTLTLQSEAARVIMDGRSVRPVSGQLACRADLERVQRAYFAEPSRRVAIRGILAGTVDVRSEDAATRVRCAARIENLDVLLPTASGAEAQAGFASTAERSWRSVYREPRVDLSGEIAGDLAAPEADIESVRVESNVARLAGTGSVRTKEGSPGVDISGELTMDMAELSRGLQSVWGTSVVFSGKHTRPFALRFPLASRGAPPETNRQEANGVVRNAAAIDSPQAPAWLVRTGVEWTTGSVYGLALGAGTIPVAFGNGGTTLGPTEFPCSGGTFRAAAQILPAAGQSLFVLDRNTRIDNFELTRELCRDWLLYVAPVVGETTESRGRLSLSTDGARLPVGDPLAGAASGMVEVHEGTVGPGPVGRQLAWLVHQVRAMLAGQPFASTGSPSEVWLRLPPQKVAFRLADRRVFHDRLVMLVGDATLYTSGSVGADRSLDIVATVPIQDAWLRGQRLADGVRGSSVVVPIRGTVSRPRVDEKRLQELSRQLLGEVAGRLLQDELLRGVNRIFGSGK